MIIRPKLREIILSLVLVVCLVWAFALYRYEFSKVNIDLRESKNQIALIKEENRLVKEKLELTKIKLARVTTELKFALKKIATSNKRIAALQNEAGSLVNEKMRLEARLRSLQDLKYAIRQVKSGIRQDWLRELARKKNLQKQIEATRLAAGNRGYLVKDGISNYKALVKIDVRPVE